MGKGKKKEIDFKSPTNLIPKSKQKLPTSGFSTRLALYRFFPDFGEH
jgi:hypothetical protein